MSAVQARGRARCTGQPLLEMNVKLIATRGNTAELDIDGRIVIVPFIVNGTEVSFAYEGESYTIETSTGRKKERHRDHSMSAPMPGVVTKILVTLDQEVTKGTPLLILEAMKMEQPILASKDGRVKTIRCREGELVQPGTDLIELI
jgi:3-methylcrotonyl-CoA carboxylase alpha subunit